MDLQTAFYIIGIVFMGLMLLLLVALVIAVFVIRAKIVSIHKTIDDQLASLSSVTKRATAIFKIIKILRRSLRKK